MAWIQNERGYWVWRRDEKDSWSSGKLIDTTSYYTSSYYNNKYTKYYSSWADSELNEEEIQKQVLISKAYKAAKDMVVVLDLPFKVKISVKNAIKFRGLNKGDRRICVSTGVFDSNKDDTYKVNVFCGSTIHEACHLKYTKFRVLESFSSRVSTELTYRLANFIEDFRIEYELMKERPGYTDFITLLNEYEYENLSFPRDSGGYSLFNNIIKYIKYPGNIDSDVITSNNEFFTKLAERLKGLSTTKDSCILAKEIVEEDLKSYFYEKKSLCNKWMSENFSTAIYGSDVDSEKTASIFKETKSLGGMSGKIFSDVLYGNSERGENYNTIFEYIDGNKSCYEMIKSKIKQYIPGIRKLLINIEKNYSFNIYGCRSGALDTNKLAEAYQNVPQVYVRQGRVSTNKVSVCVLVDESGSMCDWIGNGESRSSLAQKAAVLLNEGFNNIPGVGLYIYGHSADEYNSGDTVLNIYREPGNKRVNDFALSEIQPRQENRDGTAILEVAKRIRKLTDDHILFIVLSDGVPCADGYWGEESWDDVKKSVEWAESHNMDVVQVNIGDVSEYFINKTFKKHIDLEDTVSTLPHDLSGIIKKLVIENKESTVSM